MVFCCHGLPDESLPTAQKIERWISRMDEPTEEFKEDIKEIFKTWLEIATLETCNEGFSKIPQRISPVEFIFIGRLPKLYSFYFIFFTEPLKGVLLYQLRGQSPVDQGRAIYILRHTVRREFKDIRNNSTVGKAMWRYVNLLKVNPTAWITSAEAVLPKGKRKWKEESDDECLFKSHALKRSKVD